MYEQPGLLRCISNVTETHLCSDFVGYIGIHTVPCGRIRMERIILLTKERKADPVTFN